MKASEKTIIKVLVNLKTCGYMGRCVRRFTPNERSRIIDELIARGLIDEHLHPTAKAQPIILRNLALSE